MKDKMKVQFGSALEADLEQNTWTFEMQDGYKVFAGEFAILPKDQFEELINKALEHEK